jgi:hypothetical protein
VLFLVAHMPPESGIKRKIDFAVKYAFYREAMFFGYQKSKVKRECLSISVYVTFRFL